MEPAPTKAPDDFNPRSTGFMPRDTLRNQLEAFLGQTPDLFPSQDTEADKDPLAWKEDDLKSDDVKMMALNQEDEESFEFEE